MKGGPTLYIVKLFILRRNHNPEWFDRGGGEGAHRIQIESTWSIPLCKILNG